MTDDPRSQLVEICHVLATRSFTTAKGGNLSVRLPDDTFWVTPSSLHKARVQVDDLVRVNLGGEKLDGVHGPSSETFMHLMAYQALPEAKAIIHAHPPFATGFTQAGITLDTASASEAVAILGARIPLIPYAHPGSSELAELVGRMMQPKYKAYLMAHHGVLTWGEDLWDAYDILETVELFAQSLLTARLLGGPVSLSEEDLRELMMKYHGEAY